METKNKIFVVLVIVGVVWLIWYLLPSTVDGDYLLEVLQVNNYQIVYAYPVPSPAFDAQKQWKFQVYYPMSYGYQEADIDLYYYANRGTLHENYAILQEDGGIRLNEEWYQEQVRKGARFSIDQGARQNGHYLCTVRALDPKLRQQILDLFASL